MSDYYQCEATSTTKDKTLARESNLPMATMFIYIFIFFAICLIVFIFYYFIYSNITNITNITNVNAIPNYVAKVDISFVAWVNTYHIVINFLVNFCILVANLFISVISLLISFAIFLINLFINLFNTIINLFNTIIKYGRLIVILLLFILFGIFITAIVNVSA